MSGRTYTAWILSVFLLVACGEQETDIVPGVLYNITTTEGDGFALFERTPNKRWTGIYYLDDGRLMATKRTVSLKVGKELILRDSTGKKMPVISYSPYEEPEYVDYPETWAYRDSVYEVSVKNDVEYGKAQGYWVSYPDTGAVCNYSEIYRAKKPELKNGKRELELTMDVYLPDDARTVTRPLLVLIHDGAFFNGDKADIGYPEFAYYFAGRGYVVASVNYRLGFWIEDIDNLITKAATVKTAGFRAVQDVDAAIRYIVHQKDSFNVDPERVFVAGASAGGITALNVAFMSNQDIPDCARDEGGIKSVNPHLHDTYTIRAVGNMWGAVYDMSILDNATTAVTSYHNICDPIVPYGSGYPFKNVFYNWAIMPLMYGSGEITRHLGHERAALKSYDRLGKHMIFFDRDDAGHKTLNTCFYEIASDMRNFFSARMLSSPVIYKHNERLGSFQVESSDLDSVYWRVEGGVIQKQTLNSIDVLLFPDAVAHSVTVSGKYKNGLTFRKDWNL